MILHRRIVYDRSRRVTLYTELRCRPHIADRGTPPRHRMMSGCARPIICGAICPAQGIAADFFLPRCNTAAMALHLAEISRMGTPGACCSAAQAWLAPFGQARHPRRYHLDPAASPELNRVENVWQFIRDNWSAIA